MTDAHTDHASQIDVALVAAQNDAFRRLACLGTPPDQAISGRMHVTRALMEAGDGIANDAIAAVGAFDDFSEDNDPDGYHDFGAVEIGSNTVFWKIDLYETSSDFRYGAESPDDPATTTHVLTIMFASDW